jgi:drug/metabolite transporter (DMT)-like permease
LKLTKVTERDAGGGYYATLVVATFLMASSFIAGKILLGHGAPPFLLVGWRFALASAASLPLVFMNSKNFRAALFPERFRLRDWATLALIGILQTSLAMGLLFWAMETIAPPTAAILLFTNPLFVALLGRIFLGEALSGLRLIGLFLGILGVVFAMGSGFQLSREAIGGEFLGLAAALAWAISTVVNKRAALPINNWALSSWQMLIGALGLLSVAFARGERWPPHLPIEAWGWFLWLSIPGSTASFGLWFLALRRGGATRSSGYLFLAPLFTIILSAVILHSDITLSQALGGVLVGLSLWLVNQPNRADRSIAKDARFSKDIVF